MLVAGGERVGGPFLRDAEARSALAERTVGVRGLVLVHVDRDDLAAVLDDDLLRPDLAVREGVARLGDVDPRVALVVAVPVHGVADLAEHLRAVRDDERVVVRRLRVPRRAHRGRDLGERVLVRTRLVVLEADGVVEAGRRAVHERAAHLGGRGLDAPRLVGVEPRRREDVAAATVGLARHALDEVGRGDRGHHVAAV